MKIKKQIIHAVFAGLTGIIFTLIALAPMSSDAATSLTASEIQVVPGDSSFREDAHNATLAIGGTHLRAIGGTHLRAIGGTHLRAIGGTHLRAIGGTHLRAIGGTHLRAIGGTHLRAIGGTHLRAIGGSSQLSSAPSTELQSLGTARLVTDSTGLVFAKNDANSSVSRETGSYEWILIAPFTVSDNGHLSVLGNELALDSSNEALLWSASSSQFQIMVAGYADSDVADVYLTNEAFAPGASDAVVTGTVESVNGTDGKLKLRGGLQIQARTGGSGNIPALQPGDVVFAKGNLY